ncbi:ABC transporter ATP-binding protein [Clostridium hydrogenum]|uniref:ABC transporter ATP-binding protein n=1 Tax=Clostridium hydrogenum TaxID=2855764 RepID=UPI001F2CC42F|nr:ABC transporter ATP-binding protein [Clostridium hydrogenum]
MKKLIELEKIAKNYNGKVVLNNINLDIFENQLLAIIGPNGTGKSTLLRIISGLSTASSGKRIVYNKQKQIKIGYVPDRFPKLNFTPKEYLYYMGSLQGLSKEFIRERSEELFRIFNMQNMKDTRIKYLSKGTIQKVSVMQAIMDKPDMLLLDEPISGQDSEAEKVFVDIIEQLKEKGISIVLACHEMYLVERLADRVINIINGEIESDECKNQDKTYMKICFKIDVTAEIKLENIIDLYEEDGHTVVLIDKNFSDKAILKLLKMGASIISVNSYGGKEND